MAIAWEVADEAVEVLSTASNLVDAERRLEERLTEVATRVVRTAQELAEAVGVRFLGLDCSLAPIRRNSEVSPQHLSGWDWYRLEGRACSRWRR